MYLGTEVLVGGYSTSKVGLGSWVRWYLARPEVLGMQLSKERPTGFGFILGTPLPKLAQAEWMPNAASASASPKCSHRKQALLDVIHVQRTECHEDNKRTTPTTLITHPILRHTISPTLPICSAHLLTAADLNQHHHLRPCPTARAP